MSAGHERLARRARRVELLARDTQAEEAARRLAALLRACPAPDRAARRAAARAVRLLGRIARLERAYGPELAAHFWAAADARPRHRWGPAPP